MICSQVIMREIEVRTSEYKRATEPDVLYAIVGSCISIGAVYEYRGKRHGRMINVQLIATDYGASVDSFLGNLK